MKPSVHAAPENPTARSLLRRTWPTKSAGVGRSSIRPMSEGGGWTLEPLGRRAHRGTGLERLLFSALAREVLMRWESCLGTRSAEVLRAVYDGQHLT